jgi:hypothetical protein
MVTVLAIAVGASAVLLTGCSVSIGGDKKGGTYSDHGVSLKVPDGWHWSNKATYQAEAGKSLWSEGFGPGSGKNIVIVTAYATKVAITSANAERYASAVSSTIEGLIQAASGTVNSGPIITTMGGMTGYRFETSVPGDGGKTLDAELVMVWNGKTEYFVNCQLEAGSSSGAEIVRGCKTIVSTFKLS